MCLKFLLEGNPENQALVSSLEAREVAPSDAATQEALEKMGANLDLSENGKVKITGRKASWLKNLQAERERERLRAGVRENGRVLGEVDADARENGGDNSKGKDKDKGKGKEKAVDDDNDDDDDEIEFM